MSFLELYIDSIIMGITFYIIGRILFEKKSNPKITEIIKIIVTILIFSGMLAYINYINLEILHGVIKIICVYILYCLYYKTIFKEMWPKVLTASLILYLCLFVSEIIIALIASFLFNNSLAFLKNSIIINLLIGILDYIIIKILNKKLTVFVRNSDLSGKSNIILILIILVTMALLVFRIPVIEWSFNAEFVVTMLTLLSFCIIALLMLRQKAIIKKTNSMYHQLAQYSDITNDVLEEYRIANHEYKNQLLIIRSMINKNNKELIDYADSLLEKVENIKYKWIGQLNHLPLSGLKGLINYKILEMESLKLNKSISISNEVSKMRLNKLSLKQKDNLYSIIGVYLDNAIQATKDSKEKEISLEIYKEKMELVIIVANTYKGKIDLDKIDEYGYTTKGKNHGVGLHLVRQIISSDPTFQTKNYLLDNYFVQEVRVNLKNIKTK